jgi:hypothetical protein
MECGARYMIRLWSVVIILSIALAGGTRAEPWRAAAADEAREVVNCIISTFLKPEFFRAERREEIVVRYISENNADFPMKPERLSADGAPGFYCARGLPHDYFPHFSKEGEIVLSNGKREPDDGIVKGMRYWIGPIMTNGRFYFLEVGGGSRSWKKTGPDTECEYLGDPTGEHYLLERQNGVILFVGKKYSSIAQTIVPYCAPTEFGWSGWDDVKREYAKMKKAGGKQTRQP